MLYSKSPLAFHQHVLLLVSLFHLLTVTASHRGPPLISNPTTHPKPAPKPPTLHTPRTTYLSPSPHTSPRIIALLTTLIERLYDTLAYALLDRDFLDAHDLTLRVGALRLDFYCVAEVLGLVAVRSVVKRLGQLVQGGLSGIVVGGVEEGRGVGVVFAIGVEGEGW